MLENTIIKAERDGEFALLEAPKLEIERMVAGHCSGGGVAQAVWEGVEPTLYRLVDACWWWRWASDADDLGWCKCAGDKPAAFEALGATWTLLEEA